MPSLPLSNCALPLSLDSVQRARRGLAIYLVLVIIGSGILEWMILTTGDSIEKHMGLITMLMWTPAVASLIARAVLREGIRDVSFRLGGKRGARALVAAWLVPVAIGLIAYGIAWATGLVPFGLSAETAAAAGLGSVASLSAMSPVTRFLFFLAGSLTIGTLFASLTATGEEIGWRGYMLTRLVDAKIPKPLVVSGIIWGAWHMPLILSGQYASSAYPALSALLFGVTIVSGATLIGTLRFHTGSVWPAVLGHAAWNSVIQGPFDNASRSPDASLWIGESGVIVAAVCLVVAILVARRRWAARHWPDEEVVAL
jgi:membrane protease YdiL (CAAX protease family)